MKKSTKQRLLIAIGIAVALLIPVVIWIVFYWQPGPSYEEMAHLESPEIIEIAEQEMMTISTNGVPAESAAEAIPTLLSAWNKAGGKWSNDTAIRAQWTGGAEGSDVYNTTTALAGEFAMPVPEGVTELPEDIDERIELDTWYGQEYAQILHVGSYANEMPTIERLELFIRNKGYVVDGPHEEVYLKGPNMFGFGKEENYLTIIRYPVAEDATEGMWIKP